LLFGKANILNTQKHCKEDDEDEIALEKLLKKTH
jgi:hypothetical protein